MVRHSACPDSEGMELNAELLQEWTDLGLVTEDQRDVLAGRVLAEPSPRRRRGVAVVAEGLGYLGGAVSTAALCAITSTFWADLEMLAQIALLSLVAVVMLGAGAVTGTAGPAMKRLGSLLWFLSVSAGTAALTMAVLEVVDVPQREERFVYLGISFAATAYAGGLWAIRARSLQQIALAAGVANLVVAFFGLAEHTPS